MGLLEPHVGYGGGDGQADLIRIIAGNGKGTAQVPFFMGRGHEGRGLAARPGGSAGRPAWGRPSPSQSSRRSFGARMFRRMETGGDRAGPLCMGRGRRGPGLASRLAVRSRPCSRLSRWSCGARMFRRAGNEGAAAALACMTEARGAGYRRRPGGSAGRSPGAGLPPLAILAAVVRGAHVPQGWKRKKGPSRPPFSCCRHARQCSAVRISRRALALVRCP